MLIGVLERKPELNYDEQGTASMPLYLMVNWLAQVDNDEREKQTERFAVLTSGWLSEWCSQYLHLGGTIAVEGYLRMRHEHDNSSWRILMYITAVNVKVITNGEIDAEFEDEKITWASQPMYPEAYHPFH